MSHWLALEEIKIKNRDALINSSNIIVVTGPNNSGKSTILREIGGSYFDYNNPDDKRPRKLVENIKIKVPKNQEEYDEFLEFLQNDLRFSKLENHGRFRSIKHQNLGDTDNHYIPYYYDKDKNIFSGSFNNIIKEFMTYMDGPERFKHLEPTTYNLDNDPSTFFELLYKNEDLLNDINSSINKEFNAYIYPIFTAGHIEIKVEFGNKFFDDFKNYNEENLKNFFRKLIPIKETGDGVKSFISLLFALKSPNNRIIIIDEPETFLHPPTARSLGRLVAENSNSKTIIVATHSSEILSGIIDGSDKVTVFRTTNIRNGIKDFALTKIDENDIKKLNTDPMLRAIEIQNCLFYKGSIITEGDSDRIFYSSVMRILQINNLNIVPAQNAQTIASVIAPLRKLNIPVVGIFDLDVLLPSNDSEFTFLKSAEISEADVQRLTKEIKKYQKEFESQYDSKRIARDELKKKGISIYPYPIIIEELAKAGLFIVPVGELENWLSPKCLHEKDNKKNWIKCIIEEISNENMNNIDINSDVWAFMRKIEFWINNYAETITEKRNISKNDLDVPIIDEQITSKSSHNNKNLLDSLKTMFGLGK